MKEKWNGGMVEKWNGGMMEWWIRIRITINLRTQVAKSPSLPSYKVIPLTPLIEKQKFVG